MSENLASAQDRLYDLVTELLDEGKDQSEIQEWTEDAIRDWVLARRHANKERRS